MSNLTGRSLEDLTSEQWQRLAGDADPEGTEYEQLLAGLVKEYAPEPVEIELVDDVDGKV